MARLWQSGFEWNTITANEEFTLTGGTPVIQSTVVRSGTKAMQITALTSATARYLAYQRHSSANNGVFFYTFYFYLTTAPTGDNVIFAVNNTANLTTLIAGIKLTSSSTLVLYDEDSASIGSASATLVAGIWNRVDFKIDTNGAGSTDILEARLNGTVFATSSTRNLSAGVLVAIWGGNLALEAQTTANWYFDDIAINDSTGSYQTSYPTYGKILELRPNASGDSNQWNNTANGAGGSTNYTLVDEDNPNDATDMVQSVTANNIDLYNITDSGLTSGDTVNVVMVGGKFRNNTADATTAFRFLVEKASGGTITESSSIVPNSTTWNPHATAVPRKYPIIQYLDPDNSVAWSNSTLDTAQIGVKLQTAGTNRVQVTKVTMSVDYTPENVDHKSTSFATSVTAMAVNTPFPNTSGDLLIALVSTRLATAWTLPTGWTELASQESGGVGELTIFYKISDGTETEQLLFTSGTATTASWVVYRIPNGSWDGSTVPEVATASSGGTPGSESNPPSLTPSWGSANNIWLAVGGASAEVVTLVSYPSGYTGIAWNSVSATGSSCSVGVATKSSLASSEDPGVYDTDASRWWYSATIAIKVSSGGSSSIKTQNGLAKASIKTVNNLAIASVKTINGLS